MHTTFNSHANELTDFLAKKMASMIQVPETDNDTPVAVTGDHLIMTKEKLDYAVMASTHILQEAANGKLPRYV